MGKRKPPYIPKPYESTKGKGDTSSNIYESMLLHPAFRDLTMNQRALYMYMKDQKYAQKRKPIEGDDTTFYFNQCKWLKGGAHSYDLYSNKDQFYKDRDTLVSHGFIEIVENNKNQRCSNVYRLSDGWRTWQAKPP